MLMVVMMCPLPYHGTVPSSRHKLSTNTEFGTRGIRIEVKMKKRYTAFLKQWDKPIQTGTSAPSSCVYAVVASALTVFFFHFHQMVEKD